MYRGTKNMKCIEVVLLGIFVFMIISACENKNTVVIKENDNAIETTTIDIIEETTIVNSVKELSYEDFIVYGDNSVTRSVKSSNVIEKYENFDDWAHSFVIGDDAKTYRNISFSNIFDDVINTYGKNDKKLFNDNDNVIGYFLNENPNHNDLKTLEMGDFYIEYPYLSAKQTYHLRFYFNENSNLKLILYYYLP